METVAIVGVGLIGGSFGLALRKAGFSGEIIGVSGPPALSAALARGAISSTASLAEAAGRADLLYLAQPVDRILNTIASLGPLLSATCLVTDAGSTKRQIVSQASRFLSSGSFLGGHPLAGKEVRGAQAADADLFLNRPYVLTPVTASTPASEDFRSWLGRMGASIIELSPDEHDQTVALTSHLPQLLSTALAATLAHQSNPHLQQIFGPGLVDMTRLARSSPDLWLSILSTNLPALTAALDSFLASLSAIREALGKPDLSSYFEDGAAFAAQLRKLDSTSPPGDLG
jgi:prephenate dehydrogenase